MERGYDVCGHSVAGHAGAFEPESGGKKRGGRPCKHLQEHCFGGARGVRYRGYDDTRHGEGTRQLSRQNLLPSDGASVFGAGHGTLPAHLLQE